MSLTDQLDKTTLFNHLWGAADILRGSIDASEYKNYILGLLFYKRLCDVYDEEFETWKQTLGDIPDADFIVRGHQFHRFQIPEGFFWSDLREKSTDIGAHLNKTFEEITLANGPALQGIFTRLDFNDKEALPDYKLQKLVQHFSRYNLSNKNVSPDLLGEAYLYLISQFASGAGKKGGEFFTPPMVVKLVISLIDPHEGASVYDPTCGSGGMLLESVLHVRAQGGNVRNLFLFGQEINVTTFPIARMNMLLHDLDADIRLGDSLRDPKFLTPAGELRTFDYVAANPPFSLEDWGYDLLKDSDAYNRFNYGVPPRKTGDMAFIQHIVASLKPGGRAAVIMPHGVLFRSGAEQKIREQLIKADLIEAVVGLPDKLFFGTGIPGSILVFNKQKPDERKYKIIFINGAKDFQAGKNQNTLRQQDLDRVVAAFTAFQDEERYVAVVDKDNLEANNYNLNITRYVDMTEQAAQGDVAATLQKLRQLEAERAEAEIKLYQSLQKIGYGAD